VHDPTDRQQFTKEFPRERYGRHVRPVPVAPTGASSCPTRRHRPRRPIASDHSERYLAFWDSFGSTRPFTEVWTSAFRGLTDYWVIGRWLEIGTTVDPHRGWTSAHHEVFS
jgi:hypothetical protein